jgi:hypothetical protein
MSTDTDGTGRRVTVSVGIEMTVPVKTYSTVLWRETVYPEALEDTIGVELTIDVDDDGRPTLVAATRFSRPLSVDELNRVDWRRTVIDAYYNEALRNWNPAADVDERYASFEGLVEQANKARTTRRRRGLTANEMQTVVEAYQHGKADEVARRLGVGLRQATRYIGRAREKGLL